MPSEAEAYRFIAGIFDEAAGVAGSGGNNSFGMLKDALHTPKTAAREDGGLLGSGGCELSIDGRLWHGGVRRGWGPGAERAECGPTNDKDDDHDSEGAADLRCGHFYSLSAYDLSAVADVLDAGFALPDVVLANVALADGTKLRSQTS